MTCLNPDTVKDIIHSAAPERAATTLSRPEVKYAHSVQDNLRRLMYPLTNLEGMLVIHPAFRAALDVELA